MNQHSIIQSSYYILLFLNFIYYYRNTVIYNRGRHFRSPPQAALSLGMPPQITSAILFSCFIAAAENCRGMSFAEVHAAPSSRRGRKNYGTLDSKVRDQPSPSLGNCDDCVTGNADGSLSHLAADAPSCDSLSRPATFFIGTPRDSEESSIPRTGFAPSAGRPESASDAEAGDWENRFHTESSAALLPKPCSSETDKI